MKNSKATEILGTGSFFPKHSMTNFELAEKLESLGVETNDEWIRERTGIHARRISEDKNEAETNSSLGTQAALRAMEMANVKANELDFILYATCSPDTPLPSTACWVQKKLGAKNAWALDVNAACSGFVFALTQADQFIRTGHAKKGLVIGGEVLHPYINWYDRSSCILFGDGAGAAVVGATESDSQSQILSTHLRSDGELWDLFYIPGGGSRLELTAQLIEDQVGKMSMKGKEIFKVATKTLSEFALKALNENGFTPEDLDWFVPHQANQRILEAVAKRLNLPNEKLVLNLDRFGNTSAATVPTALDEAVRDGRIKKGNLVLLDVFGSGLTYGSILMRY